MLKLASPLYSIVLDFISNYCMLVEAGKLFPWNVDFLATPRMRLIEKIYCVLIWAFQKSVVAKTCTHAGCVCVITCRGKLTLVLTLPCPLNEYFPSLTSHTAHHLPLHMLQGYLELRQWFYDKLMIFDDNRPEKLFMALCKLLGFVKNVFCKCP